LLNANANSFVFFLVFAAFCIVPFAFACFLCHLTTQFRNVYLYLYLIPIYLPTPYLILSV
jgi:hypothetical protein